MNSQGSYRDSTPPKLCNLSVRYAVMVYVGWVQVRVFSYEDPLLGWPRLGADVDWAAQCLGCLWPWLLLPLLFFLIFVFELLLPVAQLPFDLPSSPCSCWPGASCNITIILFTFPFTSWEARTKPIFFTSSRVMSKAQSFKGVQGDLILIIWDCK